MKSVWFTLVFVGAAAVSMAQSDGHRLRLRTESPDLPLAEARVKVLRTGVVLSPDADGVVQLPVLKGNDTLEVSHPEGQTLRLTLNELADQRHEVMITTRTWLLQGVVIAANRAPEPALLVPQVVDLTDRKALGERQPLNSADAVEQMGVFIQRSQLGGGSPVLRGFEASRVLIVVDGVRLNNAVYRAGHLQNLVTLDPQQLERIEVVAGPGSSLYGSDALGGTIHLTTLAARLGNSEILKWTGNAGFRSASAVGALSGVLSLNGGSRKWATRTTFSMTDYGDLRVGNIRLPVWGKTGSRPFTQTLNAAGADVQAINPDRNVQTGSAYQQFDVQQKLTFQPREGLRIGLNAQLSNSSNIPRYDRLSETAGGGLPRFAEWYYGPQFRALMAPSLEIDRRMGLFDNLRVIASAQITREDRLQRRWNNASLQAQRERINVWSLNADLAKRWSMHEIAYGVEASYQTVASAATLWNRLTSALLSRPDLTRYPAGGSAYTSAAAYVSDRFELARGLWANGGLRYQWVGVDCNFIPENNLPFQAIRSRYSSLVGNASLIWLPRPSLRWTALVSTGFRAPNVDDIGKFFEAPPGQSANVLIVPNANLSAERTTNLESTVSFSPTFEGGCLTVAATAWYTWFDDALFLSPTRALGSDSVTFNGNRVATYSIQNTSRAELWGLTGRIAARLVSRRATWQLTSAVHYTVGRVTAPTASPLDHVAPIYGITTVRYATPNWHVELVNQWSGWKWAADYRPFGEDNLQYATPNGIPAWVVWTLRSLVRLSAHASTTVAVENLQDLHYRTFSSGISAPGRNLIFGLNYSW